MQESALDSSHTIVIFFILPAIVETRYHSDVTKDGPDIEFLSYSDNLGFEYRGFLLLKRVYTVLCYISNMYMYICICIYLHFSLFTDALSLLSLMCLFLNIKLSFNYISFSPVLN